MCKNKKVCIFCNSNETIKYGKRNTQNRGFQQRYYCKKCNKSFIKSKPDKNMKFSIKLVSNILDMYSEGLSYRKIAKTYKRNFNLTFSHSVIGIWIEKFSYIFNKMLDLLPKESNVVYIDETEIKCHKKKYFQWNAIDSENKIVIANHISEVKNIEEGVKFMRKIRVFSPKVIISDGLLSYRKAFKKVFGTKQKKTIYLKEITSKTKKYLYQIESYYSVYKERLRLSRSHKNLKSIKIFSTLFQTHFNFIRYHTTLEKSPYDIGPNTWFWAIKKYF